MFGRKSSPCTMDSQRELFLNESLYLSAVNTRFVYDNIVYKSGAINSPIFYPVVSLPDIRYSIVFGRPSEPFVC